MLCRGLGRTGVPERAIRRLAELTGGNPLFARALLAELPDERLKASDGWFRAPRSLAGLILPRLAALPRPARELVLAAAVLGDHIFLADAATVAAVADPAAALDKAERAGFLTEQRSPADRMLSFPHPLIRQAVYDDLAPERRKRLHLRAAAILRGSAALAHRSAAAAGPDTELAADLSAAAAEAANASKLLPAARYLQQAAAVTERGPGRDDLALSAFELLVRAADVAAAEAARPTVEQLPGSVRRDTALGQLALLAARPLEANALLRAAWEARGQQGAESTGGEAALGLGQLLGMSGSFIEGGVWLDRALASGTGSEHWYDAACCLRCLVFALNGEVDKAFSLLHDLPSRAAMVPATRTDALAYRGLVRLWSGDLHAAAEDLTLAASRISSGLQVRFPGPPLGFLAETEFRLGRWDDARGHAELAVALAYDADRNYDLAFVHSQAVPVAACRGEWPAADEHLHAAERAARTFGGLAAIFAASACGILGFARDRPQDALRGAALALAVPEIDRYDDPAAFWWRQAQAWALVQTGDLQAAEAVIGAFESRAAERAETGALVQAAWLRGQLAMARGKFDEADQVLRASRHTARGLPLPFLRGLLDLEHGRCLARLQQRGPAIEAVRAACSGFRELRAAPFMRAGEFELAALGLQPRSSDDPDLPGLTAQELRVARLVASGMSNREAAGQLYLSPKTVEYHLAHAFTKLGVRTRHQLSTLIRGGEIPGVATRGKPREVPDAS